MRYSVNLEEVLNTSLAGNVAESDEKVDHSITLGKCGGIVTLTEVGGALGVLVVAVSGLVIGRDVLDTVMVAVADFVVSSLVSHHSDVAKDAVGEVLELILDISGDFSIVISSALSICSIARNSDSVSDPSATILVVEAEEELLCTLNNTQLNSLLLDLSLDGGKRIVATGDLTHGAISTFVAKVALATLDLASIPELVEVAGMLVGAGGAGNHVGGFNGTVRGAVALGKARCILHLVARTVAAVGKVGAELLDVFAGTVARTALGAGRTAAALAFVAVEALAFARLAVTRALVAALGVVVSLVGAVSSVRPSKSLGATPQGAIGALPILVAGALLVGTADAVATAGVGADSCATSDKRDE